MIPPMRRGVLAGAATSLAPASQPHASVLSPAVQPDADLLAACAAFDDLERAYIATDHRADFDSPEHEAAEAERDRIGAAQEPFVAAMVELRATTMAGIVARVRSLTL